MSLAVPRPPIVLVVEDDLLLRMDAVDIVRNAGFEAIEAANADQAIAIIEADPDIHIVFMDVQMPGTMDGPTIQSVRPQCQKRFLGAGRPIDFARAAIARS